MYQKLGWGPWSDCKPSSLFDRVHRVHEVTVGLLWDGRQDITLELAARRNNSFCFGAFTQRDHSSV